MLVERIKLLAEQKNYTIAELERLSGFGKATIAKWNSSSPSAEKLFKVANILSVSMEYLISGETKNIHTLDSNIKFINVHKNNLVENFEKLTTNQQERICARIEQYLEECDYTDEIYIKECNNNYMINSNNRKYIPNLGLTAAGEPIPLPDDYTTSDLIPMPESTKADFALTVRGNSMEPDILNGSTIYIKQKPSVENGSIAIVALDDTVTCKKFYKINDNIELRSINPNYDPIIITPNNNINFRIIGEVVNA